MGACCFEDTIQFHSPKICDPIKDSDLEDPIVDYGGGYDPMDLDDGCNDTPLPIVPPLPNGVMNSCGGNFDPDPEQDETPNESDLPEIVTPPYTPYMHISDDVEDEGGKDLNLAPDDMPYVRNPDDDAPVGELEPDIPVIHIVERCPYIGSLEPDIPIPPSNYDDS